MSDGELALDAMIAKLRRARMIAVEAARIAAPKLEAEIKRTAAAGTTPEGKPWAPLKYSGQRALVKASEFVSAKQFGSTVALILTGAYVLHNFGTGHAEKRRILPERGAPLPERMRAICAAAAKQAFEQAMR